MQQIYVHVFFSSSRVLNTLFSSPIHVSIRLVIPLCFWGNLIFFNQLFLVFRSGTSMEITSDIRNTACGIFPIGVVRLDTCIWCMSISIVPNTQDTDVLSCKLIFASCPDKCDKSRKNLSLKNVLCSCFATSDTLILTKAKKKICNIWIWMKIEKNIVFTKYVN